MSNQNTLSAKDARKKFIGNTYRPMGKKASVRSGGENACRIVEARNQAKLTPVPPEQIAKYTNEFLAALGMPKVESPRIEIPPELTNDEI